MRLLRLFVMVALLTAPAATAAQANPGPPRGPMMQSFEFWALLGPAENGPETGFGLLRFSQPVDADKIVYLDIWVLLAPNHSYELQRAVDTNVDDVCTGTNWLTLGKGLVPEPIVTNDWGFGRAALFRDLSAVPTGTTFDIHFRVIDANTEVVVLQSGCHQFTVRQ